MWNPLLNPGSCSYPNSQWLAVRARLEVSIYEWLPLLKHLVVFGLTGLLGLAVLYGFWLRYFGPGGRRRLQWQRGVLWTIALSLVGLLVVSPPGVALANRSLISLIPPDSGETANAIVVLGRGREMRLDRGMAAAQLWRTHRAPRIFISGAGDALAMMALLQKQGVPIAALDGEECSRTTEENAQFTSALLLPQGIKRIILVTDPPHMMRSLLTFQSLGFEVIPHPSTSLTALRPALSYGEKAELVFRECAGLLVYGLRGRYFERPTTTVVSLRSPHA